MTPIPTLIEALGFPGLELEEKLSTVPPPPKRWAVHPSPSDRKEAKRLLVQQRRADPSFKDPAARNRNIFLTKKAVQKRTDEDAWQFSLHEIGRAIDSSFFNFDARHQSSVGIVASLFELGEDQDVQGLWNHARDASFRQGGTIRRMLKGLTGKQTARANPCPWLEKVTAQGSVTAAVLLCQVGVTPASLNKALELALTNKQYDTARELMRFGAKMPTQLALYERAVSKSTVPDETFVRLWLSTAPPIPRRECAIHAMARAANSRRGRMNQILSLLLANIPLEAEEVCMLLQRALNARNLGGAALLSLAINEKWEHLSNEDISKTAAIISEIGDNGIRYKALHFLLLLFGPRADNAVLRALMLEEAKAQHLAHLELLVRFGVFPGEWTRPNNNIYTVDNSDTLAWAVASADIVVLRMLGKAQIPSDVASSVVSKIPINATDSDKVAILKSLCENHGASGWRLSQQLLVAVQRSSQEVITTLLAFGATVDYIDEGGQNSLLVAVKRGNEALARQLCRTDPPVAVVSDCVPVAFEAMTRHNDHHMLAIFSLLVSKGARGAALEKTVIKAISTEFAASVLQILLRAGMQSAAWGQAVERAAKSAGSDILDLLFKAAPQAPVASLEAALTEVMHGGSYNPEKARILASQAQKQGHFSFLNELLTSPKRESLRHRRSVEDILLAHGANINAAQGAVLVDAVKGGNLVVLRQLLSRRPDEASMANALQEALALTGREARLEVVECLVGHGVSSNTRAFHLLDAVEKHDPALLSILFPPSGISWSQDRQSLAVAVRKGYVDEVRFLLDHGAPLSQVVSAFDYIIRAQAFSGSESLAVATSLLGQGLDQAQLDRALAAAFMRPTSGHAGLPRAFVKLLLDHGAQADAARGKYFLVAAAEGDAGVLGLLAARGFRASTVLEGLIKGVPDVRQVLWSINTIVDKSTSTVWPGMALKWAISYFPGSRSLVERLLDLGCDQSNILLWALTEQNRVLDDVLLLLIDREKSGEFHAPPPHSLNCCRPATK